MTAISSVWDDDGSFHLPALVSAPDFGQMLLTGKVVCYWDHLNFLDANAGPLIASWDYVEATGDTAWLAGRVPVWTSCGSSSIGRKCAERPTTAQEGHRIHETHSHAPHRPSLSD